MLTFTSMNRRCSAKEKVQTIMKRVHYTYNLGITRALKEQR